MAVGRRERFQVSAGGVVLRRHSAAAEVCLILRKRHKLETWCLPKGHLEPGEDAAAAAVREVLEETGLQARILQPLPSIAYQFMQPNDRTRYTKRVDFFLMAAQTDVIAPQDRTEVTEARWIPLEEALALASYEKEREVLKAALARLADAPIAGERPDDPPA